MKQDNKTARDSFSFLVNVGHIGTNPVRVTMQADENERKDMARRWGVSSVERVYADLELGRWKRDGVRIKGVIEAAITQDCVVTLEPVPSTIEDHIDALFVPEGSKLARVKTDDEGEMIVESEGPDAPETFAGNTIDVAAVCEEFIVLAIDPYPRAEGAVFEEDQSEDEDDTVEPSPFADLKAWKTGGE